MTTTREGGSSSTRERLSSPRRSKRLKQSDPNQSEIPAVVDDVVEDQGDASASANDVSDHEKKICWEDLHKMDVDYRGCGEGHNQAAEHMEEPQQNVLAAEQKEEELLAPYLVKRMMKTAVAEAWFEKSVEPAVGGGFEKIGDDTLDDEFGFEKNVEPAVGGDDTLDDDSVGGKKTRDDEAADLEMVGEKETGGKIVKK
ncbi:predicted protein [Arabidopsis lyrata subsp. lyrata]|uniref:Predicted protein n=1 Tax=Arabidopsis lyrata subsp. lyrata TaxID=81972 RepID=D7LB40_ARALL|nr:predicted protein [Arabidopsis lyrata subsp. lyrata]